MKSEAHAFGEQLIATPKATRPLPTRQMHVCSSPLTSLGDHNLGSREEHVSSGVARHLVTKDESKDALEFGLAKPLWPLEIGPAIIDCSVCIDTCMFDGD